MAEKVTSMRLNEEDLEQFKAFAKDNGLNQQQAFNSLIALAELEKAKDILGYRGKEIESFRDTINKLLNFYINSLEVNTTTEQTIREELSKELQTKDNTISSLYEQLQELKSDKINLDNSNKDIISKNKELLEQLQKANNDNTDKQSQLDIANRNNNTLQEQLTEYKEYKNTNKKLEKELEHLKADSSTKDNTISNLENNNKQFQDKINNSADMIEFYKSNNTELKDNIKALEDKYNKQIENIKAENTKALEGQLKATTEQFNNKNDIEVAKKDLELEKLKNEIEQLKAKPHRTTPSNKTK